MERTNEQDRDAVTAANAAFYAAFAHGDIPAMERLWARRSPVACIHPGWPALCDREEVMGSWRRILVAPPPVRCVRPQVLLLGETAVVICYETLDQGVCVATNVFCREDGGWRIMHHQAGATAAGIPAAAEPATSSAQAADRRPAQSPPTDERPPPRHRLH